MANVDLSRPPGGPVINAPEGPVINENRRVDVSSTLYKTGTCLYRIVDLTGHALYRLGSPIASSLCAMITSDIVNQALDKIEDCLNLLPFSNTNRIIAPISCSNFHLNYLFSKLYQTISTSLLSGLTIEGTIRSAKKNLSPEAIKKLTSLPLINGDTLQKTYSALLLFSYIRLLFSVVRVLAAQDQDNASFSLKPQDLYHFFSLNTSLFALPTAIPSLENNTKAFPIFVALCVISSIGSYATKPGSSDHLGG